MPRNRSASLGPAVSAFPDRLALSTRLTLPHNRPDLFRPATRSRSRHARPGARSSFRESITRPPRRRFSIVKRNCLTGRYVPAVAQRSPPITEHRLAQQHPTALGSASRHPSDSALREYAPARCRARLYGRNAILCYRWPATGQ